MRPAAAREHPAAAGPPAAGTTGRRPAPRLMTVDALRALALFGVLVMNLHNISGLEYMAADALAVVQGAADRVLDVALAILVDKKALSAFSFLFGLSFTLLLDSRRRKGRPFVAFYLRRLAVLAGFGALNVAFFYWADILITYSVLGLFLLAAILLPQRAVLALAAALLVGMPLLIAGLGAARPPPAFTETEAAALAVYGDGSWWQTVVHNVGRYLGATADHGPVSDWNFTNIGGLFLLGLWTGRTGIVRDIPGHAPLLRRIAAIALPLGLVMAAAEVLVPRTHPVSTAMLAGTPVLAVGYLATAALLLEHPRLHRLRDAIAPAGRVALTQYLLYGLIGQILFYGWGLGLLGEAGTATVVAIAIAVYGGLLVASRLWLARFRYGPFEWAWRSLTHLSWQRLLR